MDIRTRIMISAEFSCKSIENIWGQDGSALGKLRVDELGMRQVKSRDGISATQSSA